VKVHHLPKAYLSGGGVICVGDKTLMNVTLEGEPPWALEYTDGETTEKKDNIQSSPFIFEVGKAGTYHLTAISDKYCSYRRKK